MQIFIVSLFIIAKKQKQLKCPLIDEWINKMWHTHTVEYYLTIKINEIPIHGTTWTNLENVMLTERRPNIL